MAINVKSIVSDALLRLCESKALSKITIADLQEESGVSRQTFYNHFKDKQDLIQYVYEHRVIALWRVPTDLNLDYYNAKLSLLESDAKYYKFLKQALKLSGANCLRDFMYEHSKNFDRAWHQAFYGKDPLPPELIFASDYHSAAIMHMRIQWIMDDIPIPPEQLLENFIHMKLFSLNEMIFQSRAAQSPYAIAGQRAASLHRPPTSQNQSRQC